MDGLNHSVITGKCLGCVAYQEKVARLEDANTALAAALEEIGRHNARVTLAPESEWLTFLPEQARAALSDTGEGWPETWCKAQAAVNIEHGAGDTYPSRTGDCSACDYHGPVNDSGNIFRHRRRRSDTYKRAEAAEALVEVQQENEAELVNACIWNLEQCPGVDGHCNDVTRVHDRLLKRREELAGEEGCKCGGVLRHPCGPKCLAPAEAPRAKHRSPQSGQKKADGD